MLQAQEARNGDAQVPFSLMVLEGKRPRPASKPANSNSSVAQAVLRPYEVNLTGAQVLIGSAAVLGSIASFLWVLVRLWAFGR
jgi:hypothetical protein